MRRHHWLNRLQSALILAGLSLLAATTGALLAGPHGMLAAALGAVLLLLLEPQSSETMFRRVYGATALHPAQAPQLYAIIEEVTRRAGLIHRPTLYLIPSRQLQALAGGQEGAPVIAITTGLLNALPSREVTAVLAHEVAHLRHGDLWVMRLASTAAALTRGMGIVGTFMLLLWLAAGLAPSPFAILLLMAAPTVGELLTLSLSRRREFLADVGAAELTGDPAGLVLALQRLHALQGDDWERLATRSGAWWLRWLRTHPTIAERVRRLADTITVTPAMSFPLLDGLQHRVTPTLPGPGLRLVRRWLM